MMELVDMPDLGSGAARRVGSSPILGNASLLRKQANCLACVRMRNEIAVEPAMNRPDGRDSASLPA